MFALFVAVLVYLGREMTLFRASCATARHKVTTAPHPIAYAGGRVAAAP